MDNGHANVYIYIRLNVHIYVSVKLKVNVIVNVVMVVIQRSICYVLAELEHFALLKLNISILLSSCQERALLLCSWQEIAIRCTHAKVENIATVM